MQIIKSFKATCVHFSNDGDIASVGFADSRYDVKDYILLERALRHDSQDAVLGMDKVHITVNDQIRSCYGGIKSIRIADEVVVFEFDKKTAGVLRVSESFTVDLACEHTAESVYEMLRTVCGDGVFLA